MKQEDKRNKTRTNRHKTDTDEDKFDRYLDSIGL
jgi:hypothetical protein